MSTHVFYGDSFLVPRELKRLEADIGVGELLDANRHSLRGNQLKPAELTSICNALPFMDDRRLVLVDGLLTTLERRTGRGWRRKGDGGKSSPPLGGWKELAQAVPVMPETTVLVFLDGPLSKGNPLLRLLSPLAQVQELLAPEKEALSRWIKESAQERGSSINPAAIRCLTDLVGNDLWTMDREIEKLTLYASGRAIEQSDVMELVSQVREANIFAAVDAMRPTSSRWSSASYAIWPWPVMPWTGGLRRETWARRPASSHRTPFRKPSNRPAATPHGISPPVTAVCWRRTWRSSKAAWNLTWPLN